MKRNKLAQLSPSDQQRVFHLCSTMEYKQAAALLAQPRPQGLALQVSPSTLCRFQASYYPHKGGLELATRIARAAEAGLLPSSASLEAGLLHVLQQKLLKELSSGADLVDLQSSIRLMASLHRKALLREKATHHVKNSTEIHQKRP